MKLRHYFLFVLLCLSGEFLAQESAIYTNDLVDFNHAIDLYSNKDYDAAQMIFKRIKDDFDDASELKARCYYYEAFCAIRLDQQDADEKMQHFFEKFPTSTKRNNAYHEVAEYYFNKGQYAYALKWYNRVDDYYLSRPAKETFAFKKAYALFAVGSYSESKTYFSQLLNSERYGAQSKYYYGYMAYSDDDFDNADKYLTQAQDSQYDDDIPYYLTNIKFKTGKFQEAIDEGIPILKKSNGLQKSELSKIIGESYFNLQQYTEAVPYLLNYQGKKGKWNNTDYYMLGYAYYMQEDYDNALQWFTKIIDGNNAVSQNAYYHLGICYLKNERKQEALNAFRNAKQMDFDLDIKKDAWLNYAKLSYDIGNPYKGAADVIQEYLAAYPDQSNNQDIKALLVSAFITANDYKGALNYLQNHKTSENNATYQKVAYLYALQLFNEEQYSEAVKYFQMSLDHSTNGTYHAKAQFWQAESYYRLNDFSAAQNGFDTFLNLSEAQTTEEFEQVYYHIGYTHFKLKDYSTAGGYFNEFIQSNPNLTKQLNDSYLRLGDCFFALGSYFKAVKPYQKVIEANDLDLDYAQLQLALCYGFMGDIDKKIEALNDFTAIQLKSTLRDDAFYELGNSYVRKNQNDLALNAYNNVIEHYRMSSFAPKSLLKQGLIYYNTDQNDLALSKYKKVVDEYPGTEEAKQAIKNAKQIYIDLGRVDEYEALVKNTGIVNITDEEVENTMFASAEQFYHTNQSKKAEESLKKYLNRYPQGVNALAAHFYLGETMSKDNRLNEAKSHYEYVTRKGTSDYYETALQKLALLALQEEQWKDARTLLSSLEKESKTEANRTFAQSNLMKSNYALKDFDEAVRYADLVLQNEKLDQNIKSDAEIIIARSAFETGDLNRAQEAFKKVEQSASGEIKAEAIYYDAFFKHQEGNYKLSNVAVQKLAAEYSSYRYWGAKGLILMAKNFYEMEDAYQATYILESIGKNFGDFSDLTQQANLELRKIKANEAKTNSSVIIEK